MLTEIPETIQTPAKPQSIWKIFVVFLLGALCFLVTQILTRVPLLGWLEKQTKFLLWAMSYPLFTGILIAMSAGIFEESGRFAFKSLAIKPTKSQFWEPVVFGLGHGLCEAVWLLSPIWAMAGLLEPGQIVLAVVERLIAIAMHIGFSVMVWNGFQLDKRLRFLFLTILAHGLVNALIPLAGKFGLGILQLEGLFAVLALLLVTYAIFSRKYYQKEAVGE